MADIFGNIRAAESGGNRFAKNPLSSATGPDQFLSRTWLSTIKKHRPDIAAGRSDAELLAMRTNEKLSSAMTRAYAGDNAAYLRSRGHDPAGNTYLTHFAGPGGASAVLSNPGAPAEKILGPAVIAANPFLRGMTGADVVNWARAKETGQPTKASSAMAANVQRNLGPSTAGGATVAPLAADDRLRAALKGYDPDLIESGKTLQQQGQKIATSYGNPLGAYGGALVAGLGGLIEGSEAANKKTHDEAFIKAATSAADPTALMGVLLSSSDPKMREAGLELKAKLLTKKAETSEWIPLADGTGKMNKATGEVLPTGLTQPGKPYEVNGRLVVPQADGTSKVIYEGPPKEQSLPEDVRKYQFDMEQRKAAGQPEMTYADWRKTANADGAFSKEVIRGTKDGKPALIQAGGEGKAVLTELPLGFELSKDPIVKDAGTYYSVIDPQINQEINRIPKDVAGEARAKEVGKGEGDRLVEAPKVRASMDSSLSNLDRLAAEAYAIKQSAGLEGATGLSSQFWTMPGGDTAATEARLQTLKSQIAFSVLQAMRDASKSGGALGAVSEKELGLLENNLAGLDPKQDMEAFKAALDRVITYTGDAKERLLRSYKDTYGRDYVAGGDPTAAPASPPATANPSAGTGGFKVLRVR